MSFLPISMLLLMACCFMKPVGCQQLFSVQVLSPRMINNVTIRCEESSGNSVTDGLVFYRNGVNQLVDPCLSAGEKLEDGRFMLQVSPSCEGHYMCGTSNSGGAKLSGPRELYAFPQHATRSNTKNRIFKRFGDKANLPCSVERSALGRFRVEWTRIVNGVFEMVSIPSSDEDYSLTLTNITFQDAGIYFCTVTSLELQGLDRSLNGFNVELLVNQRHIPPEFTGPAIYEQDRREFMVTVEGSAGLMVQWFINGQQLNSRSTQLPNNVVQSRLPVSQLMGNSSIIVIASNIDAMTGERFRTRTTILALLGSQPASNSSNVNSCPGATPGVIAPMVILCTVLAALLLVAGVAILVLLKRSSKQIDLGSPSRNPISHIFTNVGIFLQQNPQSDLMDLNVLEGLSQAVGTILNIQNLTLTDKALECMENVKSSLEATKTVIRRNRREVNKGPSDKAPSVVVLKQTDPPTSTSMPKGIRKASSNPDSGIESAEGSTEYSLEEVDGAYEEIKDKEMQKIDDLHVAVTQWLKKCRVLKRQNAITDTETFDTEV